MRELDLIGIVFRWRGIICRRKYNVRGLNVLWYIGGNYKMICWWFVVYIVIDGYFRLILYLYCVNNNRFDIVFVLF